MEKLVMIIGGFFGSLFGGAPEGQIAVTETPIMINTPAQVAIQRTYPQPPSFGGITGTINTDQSTLTEFQKDNKLVLMHFWTYGCINCKRTLEHLNDWYSKYHDDGLEIVGVHTPEFAFERKPENVENFVREREIAYPVLLDNDFVTWRNYQNRYWPHRYLITNEGIVFDHIGEGAYEETEALIQEILGAEN